MANQLLRAPSNGRRPLLPVDCRGAAASFVAAAIVVAAASGHAATESKTPREWLHAMDGAFRNLDYDGVFSYYTAERAQQLAPPAPAPAAEQPERTLGFGVGLRTQTRLATYRVVHKVVNGIERERIEHLDGPPREVLRVGERIVGVLQPGDRLLALEGTLPATPYVGVFARRFDHMSDNYHVAASGRGRIAGRPTVRLGVTPRDQDRFGYRLWLDEATGLLLRSELHDVQEAKLEIFQFVSVRIGGVEAEDLAPTTPNAVLHDLAQPAAPPGPAAASASTWRAGWVPRGFRMASASGAPLAGSAVSALVYSDGLAAFSVFIEAMPEGGAANVVSRRGATVVLTHAKSGGGGHLVTVVGEVPVATARRVAAGVYRQAE